MAAAAISCSSSAASSHSPKKYEVFISFSGEDTRRNFTSHLHDALCRSHIQTYIDYRLEKGDEVWPELVKAIKDSMLFLVIFSEKYASSTWCLNELIEILECSKDDDNLVIPVFYNIEPTDIRKQTGSYQKAFAKHEHNHDHQQVLKWKAALTQAANISGWDSSTYGNEARLIGDIVDRVCKKLEPMHQSVSSDGFFGILEQIERVESLLCNGSQDVRFIGIWGMAGIGKTTIARALFEKLCFEFESFCFLPDIRKQSEKENGLTKLRDDLISQLDGKESHVGMPHGGSTYVRKRLSRKKVLIVLDDVNDAGQLKNLAGDRYLFGQGSRVVITTRDKQVLRNRNIDATYQVKALNFGQALQLFNLHAFGNNSPDQEFENLSWKVVNYAKDNPLTLVELGFILCGQEKEKWKSQLEKLEKGRFSKKIQDILKLSYDGLEDEEKHIFLDVACFFKGETAEKIKYLLDACDYATAIGLERLEDKALLTISGGYVSMHDLIQKMGREIIRQECLENPEERSRLWDPNDIYEVLKNDKGSEAIRGISQDVSKTKELNLSPQVFSKMRKLKFLQIYNSINSEECRYLCKSGLGYLSDELRYLHWINCPLKSFSSTFFAKNLVELDMRHSGIRKLWDRVQDVVNLKIINLSDSTFLMELPDFSQALNLKIVILSKCSSLRKVHPSILSLDKLEVLNLDGCESIRSVKSDIHLSSLTSLSLSDCPRLKKFSIKSENMEYLDLPETAINGLPSTIGRMFKLKSLRLSGCRSLKNLPSNLFDGLQSLQELWLDNCCNLLEIPDNIYKLSSLSTLRIQGIALGRLPASVKHLSCLKYFWLNGCRRLRCLPELPPSLGLLDATDCSSLETVIVTSTATEPLQANMKEASFRNCLKLDEHSVKAILANVMVHINKSVSGLQSSYYLVDNKTEVIYPGSRVPEWLTTHAYATSVTIDLSSAPRSKVWGLLFCIVVPQSISNDKICIEYEGDLDFANLTDTRYNTIHIPRQNKIFKKLKISRRLQYRSPSFKHGCFMTSNYWRSSSRDLRNLASDHVCLWYDERFCLEIHERLKERRATSNPVISLKLNFHCDSQERRQWHSEEIKECAVCPTYASEYKNFIKQMEWRSQSSASGMGV